MPADLRNLVRGIVIGVGVGLCVAVTACSPGYDDSDGTDRTGQGLTFGRHDGIVLGMSRAEVVAAGYRLGESRRAAGCDSYLAARDPWQRPVALHFTDGVDALARIGARMTAELPVTAPRVDDVRSTYRGMRIVDAPVAGGRSARLTVQYPSGGVVIAYDVDRDRATARNPSTSFGAAWGCARN